MSLQFFRTQIAEEGSSFWSRLGPTRNLPSLTTLYPSRADPDRKHSAPLLVTSGTKSSSSLVSVLAHLAQLHPPTAPPSDTPSPLPKSPNLSLSQPSNTIIRTQPSLSLFENPNNSLPPKTRYEHELVTCCFSRRTGMWIVMEPFWVIVCFLR